LLTRDEALRITTGVPKPLARARHSATVHCFVTKEQISEFSALIYINAKSQTKHVCTALSALTQC
jgi:hypothetical protein